jgi:SAM-dependent methyltransferase
MNSFIRNLYYKFPVASRYLIRRILFLPQDTFRNKKSLIPPKGLMFTGSGGYESIGKQFFNYFIKFGDINTDSSILDIGSGIGRMAVPFTTYLSKKGQYEGFDIVKIGVDWCVQNISSNFPNFNFKLIPLKNDLYLLDSKNIAKDLVFPYNSNSFDFVFLTSVFTHMMPNDVENYISEINRVLKPNKKFFATFFILDEISENAMIKNGTKQFPYEMGHYSLMDKKVKEANVAYKKEYIMELLAENNFEVVHFFRGNWSGIEADLFDLHQDVIILKKK